VDTKCLPSKRLQWRVWALTNLGVVSVEQGVSGRVTTRRGCVERTPWMVVISRCGWPRTVSLRRVERGL
jgi:hypothetical protein